MTTTPQAALLSDDLHALIRSFGYTTHGQTYELVTAILAKLQAAQADHIPDAGEMVEPVQAGELPDEREAFEAWLCREMPANTIIGDPKWWAPRILRAACVALSHPQQQAPGSDAFEVVRKAAIDAFGRWSDVGQGPISASKADIASKAEKKFWTALNTAIAARKPLSDDQMWLLWNSQGVDDMNQGEAIAFAREVEREHGINDLEVKHADQA